MVDPRRSDKARPRRLARWGAALFGRDDEVRARRRARIGAAAFGGGILLILVAAGLLLMHFLSAPNAKPPVVHNIALIKQPPPPPPKPPEKPPEPPPKVKEEVKLDQPKEEPKPEAPKPANEPPAADKPLGVDAEGSAGGDAFGLAANRGGRDLIGTTGGGGGAGAYYSGLLQRQFFEALSRNRNVLKEQFRVVVKVWVGDDGRVTKAEVVSGSGNAQVDEMIQSTLLEMQPLRDIPPASMRPIQLRLSNRSS
jgi:protein TonB